MVAMLLAAAGVAAGRLKMSTRIGADPDVRPRGWNGELFYARQLLRRAQSLAVREKVNEASTGMPAPNSGHIIGNVTKIRGFGCFNGVGRWRVHIFIKF